MAGHLVRALYGTASNVKSSQPRRGIVEPLRVSCEMYDGFLYQLCGFGGNRFHSLEAGDDLGLLVQGKSHQGSLNPFQSLNGPLAVLGCSNRMEVF